MNSDGLSRKGVKVDGKGCKFMYQSQPHRGQGIAESLTLRHAEPW